MKASDYIVSFLYNQGVRQVFEVVGGMITHLVDSLYNHEGIKSVSVHHEQAAAFAADATGRITGIPGVAMATSGPGAVNLLTGIGSCYFDSSPAVFITGQVNLNEQKGELPIRQLGFQETDIVSMAAPITKAAWRVRNASEIPDLLQQSFTIAMSGRPGPVLLDIPMDLQRADIPSEVPERLSVESEPKPDSLIIEQLLSDLSKAQKPLILAGGGIRSAQSISLFREFVELVQIPVVNSLMAVDILPYQHPLRIGMIGSYGNRWTNLAVGESDFLLVIGSRLDIRQTGSDTEAFKGDRIIYHVDCEAGEINNRVKNCHTLLSHIHPFLEEAVQQSRHRNFMERTKWQEEIAKLKSTWPDTSEIKGIPGINPNEFIHQLSAASKYAAAYIVDVGQHQMWAGQSIELTPGQHFLTSGGMGAMGFALPAALGTSFSIPGEPVVMIAGDGGFQVNIQELQTLARNQLPIKLVILNNHCHGMVRQFQQSYFHERYQSTYWGYSAPDFSQVAHAYGIPSRTVSETKDLPNALENMWGEPQKPFLLQVMIDTFANAYPKIAFGLPITEMEPLAKPIDMEGT